MPEATQQQGIAGLLSNPNFINLLAGIGTNLDPQGVGGALGQPTLAVNQSIAAQRALSSQEDERRKYNQQLLELLSGITPKGVAGPSSVTINPDGYTAKVELPGGGSAVSDLGTGRLDTGVTAGPPASIATPTPVSTQNYRPATGATNISQIVPFY
jgi:hypothetical protein